MINKMQLFKIFKMTQKEVKQYSKKVLKREGYSPVLRDGFLYAKGNLPILLVAHMDTVFSPPTYINDFNGVLSSKKGLGADDRAGMYAILHLVEKGYRPHILFLEDEEIGCVGARKFCKSGIEIDCKYIIELDRQGANDCVFYDCDNPKFTDYVETFGFKLDYGSYSDIAEIAPHLGVSAVNLSVGYYNQHTLYETLKLAELEDTIYKVECMLIDEDVEKYEYVAGVPYINYFPIAHTFTKRKRYSAYSFLDDDYDDVFSDAIAVDEMQGYEEYYSNQSTSEVKMIDLMDCYLNLEDGTFMDLAYENVYEFAIGDDDNIYHCDLGKQTGCTILDYNFVTLRYKDIEATFFKDYKDYNYSYNN